MANLFDLLTDEEKVRVRHHTGYLNIQNAQSFALGIPAAVQTQFLIEGAVVQLLPAALPKFRELLERCDCTEAERFDAQENLAATSIGAIQLRPDQQDALQKNYLYWRAALCNMLGIPPNPYDMRFANSGVNTPVIHSI